MKLNADRSRLREVFANWLKKTAKYTRDGGRMSLIAQVDAATATIRIRANGKGIAANALPRILDLFMQETTDHRTGVGIGLKSCAVLLNCTAVPS